VIRFTHPGTGSEPPFAEKLTLCKQGEASGSPQGAVAWNSPPKARNLASPFRRSENTKADGATPDNGVATKRHCSVTIGTLVPAHVGVTPLDLL
jgi:hypothetical protein